MPITTSPTAVIFINADLVAEVQGVFARQMFLTEIIDGPTFDARLAANPNYVSFVHINQQRILVIRSLFDQTNRQSADIVLFAKAGLVSVLINKVGPVGITLPIDRVSLRALITLNQAPPQGAEKPDLDDDISGQNDNDDFDPFSVDPPKPTEPV